MLCKLPCSLLFRFEPLRGNVDHHRPLFSTVASSCLPPYFIGLRLKTDSQLFPLSQIEQGSVAVCVWCDVGLGVKDVFGRPLSPSGGQAGGPLGGGSGTYYSYFPPEGSTDFMRGQMALPPEWGNTMSKTSAVTIPSGTTAYIGPAAAVGTYSGIRLSLKIGFTCSK